MTKRWPWQSQAWKRDLAARGAVPCLLLRLADLLSGYMRVQRLFNVLVLGGAALACEEGAPSNGGASGAGAGPHGSGASPGISGGSSMSGGDSGGASSVDIGTGGSTDPNPAGGAATAGSGGSSGSDFDGVSGGGSGGLNASGAGTGGGSPEAGSAGSAGALQCKLEPDGRGSPGNPCGCPCCWTKDCLNTDEVCCPGFCKQGPLDCCAL
jgi:hypothetical protein